MSFPPQSIPLTGAIGTTSPDDVFPTHYDSLGSGGMRAVATLAARDAIPAERRVFGMFVFVVEANSLYALRNIELGGESDNLSDNGNWKVFAPGGDGATTINHETESLAAGAVEDFTIAAGDAFHLLSLTASTPAWVRVYGTSAARAADTRTSPGGTPPLAGSEFYAELVTTTAPQTIRFSPVPLVQGTAGDAFVRVQNMDTVSRTISLDLRVITLEEYQAPPSEGIGVLLVPSSALGSGNIYTGLATEPDSDGWFAYQTCSNFVINDVPFQYLESGGPSGTGLLQVTAANDSTVPTSCQATNYVCTNGAVTRQELCEDSILVTVGGLQQALQGGITSAFHDAFTVELIVRLNNGDTRDSELDVFIDWMNGDNTDFGIPSYDISIRDSRLPNDNDEFQDMKWKCESMYWYSEPSGATKTVVDSSDLDSGQYVHIALVKNGESMNFYAGGQLRESYTGINWNRSPDELYAIRTFVRGHHTTRRIDTETGFDYFLNPLGFHGLRVTAGQALYTGSSFTPPTTITALA